ncbi:MAG TPA: contractile injection system protein, VgrG/Pvc8 family, partial [Polyangiaceae bacterium]|nr:contractile injection system protein, VgrG/Pvc8 family [Polyangiaceae bacterium]
MTIDEVIKLVPHSNDLAVDIATGTPLDVRKFSVAQAMSELFRIEIVAVSRDLDVDLDGAIGLEASFAITQATEVERWSGICLELEQIRVDAAGLATYRLLIVPTLWKLTQRTNYRIFQFVSELDIVKKLLGEWGIAFESRADGGRHKPRKYRVQYGESDFDFVARMLEDAGISFYFEAGDGGSVLVLDDAPETREVTEAGVRFHDEPGVTDARFATRLAARSRLRPGAMTIGDVDYRLPSTKQPRLGAFAGLPQESMLEQFDFEPGAFLYQGAGGGSTPFADDRGASRTDEGAGKQKVGDRLAGHRNDARVLSFE